MKFREKACQICYEMLVVPQLQKVCSLNFPKYYKLGCTTQVAEHIFRVATAEDVVTVSFFAVQGASMVTPESGARFPAEQPGQQAKLIPSSSVCGDFALYSVWILGAAWRHTLWRHTLWRHSGFESEEVT